MTSRKVSPTRLTLEHPLLSDHLPMISVYMLLSLLHLGAPYTAGGLSMHIDVCQENP